MIFFFRMSKYIFFFGKKKSKVIILFSRVCRVERSTFRIMLQLRRIEQFTELFIFPLVTGKVSWVDSTQSPLLLDLYVIAHQNYVLNSIRLKAHILGYVFYMKVRMYSRVQIFFFKNKFRTRFFFKFQKKKSGYQNYVHKSIRLKAHILCMCSI